jgi:hypothetical protein
VKDVIVGLLALGIGTLFCFRGYLAMRLVIPVWGALAGFLFGAGLVASLADDNLLATATGWLVGIGFALLFGALAYLYYEVSVILAMGAIGFSLGTGVMVALGVSWSWLIVLVGVLVGTLLAITAILADVPMILLTVLSATAGAVAMIGGAMLLTGTVDVNAFDAASTTERIDDDWWWYALYVTAALAGAFVQFRDLGGGGTLRSSWTEDGGRQLRAG